MARCSAITLKGRKCKKNGDYDGFCFIHASNEMSTCGICLEDIKINSRSTLELDCKHLFCKSCINEWIIEKTKSCSCPMCRSKIPDQFYKNAIQWGKSNGYFYSSEITTFNLSLLEEADITYFLSIFHANIYYKALRVIKAIVSEDNKEYIFDIMNETAYTGRFLIKRKDFPDQPNQMYIFRY